MKRMCKTKLSLAIALTIASSVGQYVMAESTYVTKPEGAYLSATMVVNLVSVKWLVVLLVLMRILEVRLV